MEEKRRIASPKVNQTAKDKVFARMYIANVARRLRDLNNPSDIDRKRWIWELIQNAKDTIASDPGRNDVNIRIEIEDNRVKFVHDGAPFTPEARYGLLYKYSDDKQNQESTGRFGTGFLTTHCLSKIVTVESDMFTDEEHSQLCGFKVTMFRDGVTEEELIEGLEKMQNSEEFYEQTFNRTTYTYNVNSASGKAAIELGVRNFKENIAQTMLFCKELNNVELYYNGQLTTVQRKPEQKITEDIFLAEFEFSGELSYTRRFLYTHHEAHSDKLSERYRADRKIRLDVAVEIDNNNTLVSQEGRTSYFCVLPLVGIESQLNEPIIVNSPDFEPDDERQSLLLTGDVWNEEKKVLTEMGINQLIYAQVFPLYERIVSYLSSNNFAKLYYLASGLNKTNSHKNLDSDWYLNNVIKKYRDILLKYPVAQAYDSSSLKKLSDCLFVKERSHTDETNIHSLISFIYPSQIVKDNHEWACYLWRDELNIWNAIDLCKDIEQKQNWSQIILFNKPLSEWYNEFLLFIKGYDERLLSEYALIPNMEGHLLKKNEEGFKQGENVTPFIIGLLNDLGKNVKQILLHNDISAISLSAKYNSQSFSADINNLAKSIINDATIDDSNKISKLLPLNSIVPNDPAKYSAEFIKFRNGLFGIIQSLRPDLNASLKNDNNLLPGAWESHDQWVVTHTLEYLNGLGSLSKLPHNLDATWLNTTLKVMLVQPDRLNKYKVLPNQNGDFRFQQELYVDGGVPDVLKNSFFSAFKSDLLHRDIEPAAFSIIQTKTISDIARKINQWFATSEDRTKGNYFRNKYHSYSQDQLDKLACYLVSIQPIEKESGIGKEQAELYSVSKVFLGDEKTYEEKSVAYDSIDLWQEANSYVADQIAEKLFSIGSIKNLCDTIHCNEDEAFRHLNVFYLYCYNHKNISLNQDCIYPNQNGTFCTIAGHYHDVDRIDELLKDVIEYLVPDEQEYRNILFDTRCIVFPLAKLKKEDAYKLIDDCVSASYENQRNWKSERFIKAVHLLIEEWAEQSDQFIDNNFPKSRPIEDSLIVNILWNKEKRNRLMDINTALTEEQINAVIENIEQVGNLAAIAKKVKDLEAQNALLRKQLDDLVARTNGADANNDAIRPIQVESVMADGSRRTISIALPQYADLSKEEMREYLIEAKTAVKILLEGKGYVFTKGICEDSWCNIYGVYKDGKEVPIVVHSYKSRRRGFSLNASDWEQLSKDNSMLWVNTHDGPQCVPFYALPRDTNTIAITFSPENMQYKNRCIALAETLRYFKGLQFHFGTEITSRKEPEPFNNSDKELKLSIKNSMRDIHDLPAQSSNDPIIGADIESLF